MKRNKKLENIIFGVCCALVLLVALVALMKNKKNPGGQAVFSISGTIALL